MAMNPNWGKPKHLRVSLKSKFSAQLADAQAKGRLVTQKLKDKAAKAAKAKAAKKSTALKVLAPIPGLSTLSSKVSIRKEKAISAIKSTATGINPQAPALISEQISKAKRIPYIIGGVLIAVYILFKKGRKGGKK